MYSYGGRPVSLVGVVGVGLDPRPSVYTSSTRVSELTVSLVDGLSFLLCSGNVDESNTTPRIREDSVDGTR